MGTPKRRSLLPPRLERARERFEHWRKHRKRRRIPDRLWSSAERLALEYGIHRTSRALRLNYESLKQRLESRGSAVPAVSPPATSSFVELIPRGGVAVEGVVELEDGDGGKMRVEWKGETPDLAALSRSFFGTTS